MFRTACQAGVSTKLATLEICTTAQPNHISSPITFCVFSNTSSFTAAISDYVRLQAIAPSAQQIATGHAGGDVSVNHH
jgi:hypothetical protein